MSYAININNLHKSYNNKKVLTGFNMSVPRNKIYGFLGVNGAGKTTTFGILSGFIPKESGNFNINGTLSALPQNANFFPGRTIIDQLRFFAELSDVPNKSLDEEVKYVLNKVDLYGQRFTKPPKLSHGMTKRLAIAQALLGDPDIILLDEPISGLDPKNAYEFKKLIIELGKEKTIVISSHVMADVSEMCEIIGIIHDGKMLFEGHISEITDINSKVNFRISKTVNHGLLDTIPEIIDKSYDEKKKILTISFDEKEISLESINKKIFNLLSNENIGIYEITLGKSLKKVSLKCWYKTNCILNMIAN